MTMGAGKLRAQVSRGRVVCAAIGLAALAAGCGTASAAPSPAAGPSAGVAVPTVTPTAVPALGPMTLGTFASTEDGMAALTVCEQWAGLRAEYVTSLRTDTPFQLERWFSADTRWLTAFAANSPLKTDPRYMYISTAFGLVSTAAAASMSNARLLDRACAAAD
jgi:hypothetical protein